jgi:GntR family carbon starvation induced transcriptional regulator
MPMSQFYAQNSLANAGAENAERQPATLIDTAYGLLRSAILSGRVEPGAKLKIDALQREFALSSSPLREALNRLAAEGLVTAIGRRGFHAAPITIAELSDLTNFRIVLESGALQASIERGTDEWEATVAGAYYRLEVAEGKAGSDTRSANQNWRDRHKDFHMSLFAACGSRRLIETCSDMYDQAERYRRYSMVQRNQERKGRTEHQQIMKAALARDAATAVGLLREHIVQTSDHVEKLLRAKTKAETE